MKKSIILLICSLFCCLSIIGVASAGVEKKEVKSEYSVVVNAEVNAEVMNLVSMDFNVVHPETVIFSVGNKEDAPLLKAHINKKPLYAEVTNYIYFKKPVHYNLNSKFKHQFRYCRYDGLKMIRHYNLKC